MAAYGEIPMAAVTRPRAPPDPSRRPPIDALLADDLTAWKAALAGARIPDRRPTTSSCAATWADTALPTAT